MKRIRLFLSRLVGTFRRRSVDRDLGEELRFHLETEVEYLMEQGSERAEAERLARRKFGGIEQAKEIYRDTRGFPPVESFFRDLRHGLRALGKSPGFAMVAVLTLATGMGGSVAIYTLLDDVVLSPLPYPESQRLVQLTNQVPGVGPGEVWNMSTAQYVYFGREFHDLEASGLYNSFAGSIETPDGPERAAGWRVTSSLFPLLGAEAQAGRLFGSEHDVGGFDPVVVLSYGFWQRRFGGDADVIGDSIRMNGVLYEVIGVLEPGFEMPIPVPGFTADVWLPLYFDPDGPFANNHVFPMIARLGANVDASAAEAHLGQLSAHLPEVFPGVYSQDFLDRYGFRTVVTPLREAVVGGVSQSVWVLFAAVGTVLLIASANVANLFLVRLDGRHREFAIRSALGAGRWSIARHLLAEGLVLASVAGALGLAVAAWGLRVLLSLAPDVLPRTSDIGLGLRSVGFVLAISVAVGVFLAAYPLFRISRRADRMSMDGDSRNTDSRERQHVRSAFVVGQVALALTLIIGAGLLFESVRRLERIDPGVQPRGVLTTRLYLTRSAYDGAEDMWRAYTQILQRVRAIPGVVAAGMSTELPVAHTFGCTVQGFEDSTVYDRVRDAGMTTCAGQEPTTPGYFEALGIPVLRGRTFEDADNDVPTRASVVVSQAFADRFWPGEDPIGKGIGPSGRTVDPFYRVIGVVGDVPAGSLDASPAVAVYYPMVNDPRGTLISWGPAATFLVVKSGMDDPRELMGAIRRSVSEVDPAIPLADTRTMDEIVAASMGRTEFTTSLLGLAAFVALLLSALGLFGVVSYDVSRRTREIGVRIAVGAGPGEVERLFVRKSMLLAAIGLTAGLALALATTRLLEGILYGVEPTHPATFAAAGGVLAVIALLASWIPARRAVRVDPMVALRHN